MLIWMPDIRTINPGNMDIVFLLVVLYPPAKVLVGLLRVPVVAAAIAAGVPAFQLKLQCNVEIVGSKILAQDKAVAVAEQNYSPHHIKRILFDKHTSRKKIKPSAA